MQVLRRRDGLVSTASPMLSPNASGAPIFFCFSRTSLYLADRQADDRRATGASHGNWRRTGYAIVAREHFSF